MTGQITFVADQVWPAGSGSVISVNTKTGAVVLNADDNFFSFFKSKSIKKKLKMITFGIKSH